MKMMLQSTDAIPMNFGFTGKGNTSKPEGLKEVSQAATRLTAAVFVCAVGAGWVGTLPSVTKRAPRVHVGKSEGVNQVPRKIDPFMCLSNIM